MSIRIVRKHRFAVHAGRPRPEADAGAEVALAHSTFRNVPPHTFITQERPGVSIRANHCRTAPGHKLPAQRPPGGGGAPASRPPTKGRPPVYRPAVRKESAVSASDDMHAGEPAAADVCASWVPEEGVGMDDDRSMFLRVEVCSYLVRKCQS